MIQDGESAPTLGSEKHSTLGGREHHGGHHKKPTGLSGTSASASAMLETE